MDKNDFGIVRGLLTLISEWIGRGTDPNSKLTPKQFSLLILQVKRLHNEALYTDLLTVADLTFFEIQKKLSVVLSDMTKIPGAE